MKIKSSLSSNALLSYYDPNQDTKLIVDASPYGLGAMLVQFDSKTNQEHVISYASRSLGDAETRYYQIEREALAITWAI